MKKNNNKIIKSSSKSVFGYNGLLTDISGIITQGRKAALRQVDITQVITYWLVGRRIVEFYQSGKSRAEYGQQLLFKLSIDLMSRHGRGFSERNLEMMRMFYLEYPISQTLSAKSGIDTAFPQVLSANEFR